MNYVMNHVIVRRISSSIVNTAVKIKRLGFPSRHKFCRSAELHIVGESLEIFEGFLWVLHSSFILFRNIDILSTFIILIHSFYGVNRMIIFLRHIFLNIKLLIKKISYGNKFVKIFLISLLFNFY